MKTTSSPTRWDLNHFYNGTSKEIIFNELESIKAKLTTLKTAKNITVVSGDELHSLSELIKRIEKMESFYYCLTCEGQESSFLSTLSGSISSLKMEARSIITYWTDVVKDMTTEEYNNWSTLPEIGQFLLDLSKEESLIAGVTAKALKGYEDIYIQLQNNLSVFVKDATGENELTFTKAENMAMNHPDPLIRETVFIALNDTLNKQSAIYASIYNQIIELRLHLYKMTRQNDYLEESLTLNGLSLLTLDTMWNTIEDNLPELTRFIKIRANENNKQQLTWHELMSYSQKISHNIPFSKAVIDVEKALESIDPAMAVFINEALDNGWIDTEPRDSKPRGGFCVPFAEDKESRISLYYDGSVDSARILAHELGHAWHFQQITNVPTIAFFEDRFEMTIAETSSIFFETVFIDFIIRNEVDPVLKKSLIGWKIERSLNYVLSIRGAFLFEKRFNEQRLKGPLSAGQIEELSLQAQEEVYGGSLSSYEPFVWMKYGQFYQTDTPFYNYPYTFGFLLSLGLLDISKETQFVQQFQGFLKETGTLPVEQLVNKHFDIDLTTPSFWQQSITRILNDIEQYSRL